MSKGPRISDEKRKQIFDLFATGMSRKDVAEATKVSYQGACSVIRNEFGKYVSRRGIQPPAPATNTAAVPEAPCPSSPPQPNNSSNP